MKKRHILAFLFLSTATIPLPSWASSDPVADVRQIMAGTVTTKSIKNAYLSGARDNTTAFQGALKAYKAVRAAEPPLTVKCLDGTVVTAPGVCPLPPPPPPPVDNKVCPDGTTIPSTSTCPAAPPPPPPSNEATLCGLTLIEPGSPCPVAMGGVVVAVRACVGSYIPDALVPGQRYIVVGNGAGYRPQPGADPKYGSGYILNPEIDDGLHRGSGYFGLWVPYSCVAKA